MDLLKIFAALLVLFIALAGGLLPILSQPDHPRSKLLLYYGDYFARGVFLGVALIHLLPNAMQSYGSISSQHANLIITFVCAITIFMVALIEQGVTHLCQQRLAPHAWLAYLLTVLLSIHSIIEGGALGISNTLSHVLIIFLAIMAHKGAAAFSLAINMRQHRLPRISMVVIMIVFSLMTPLGILFGAILDSALQYDTAIAAQSLFSAIAAGTFIYIATFAHSKKEQIQLANGKRSTIYKFLIFGLGIMLMALVALWI